MVTMSVVSTALTGSTHERVARPLICTVQAPHCAIPQPYFVPVRPMVSRRTHSSGVPGSASTWYDRPFTCTVNTALSFSKAPEARKGQIWGYSLSSLDHSSTGLVPRLISRDGRVIGHGCCLSAEHSRSSPL